MSMQGRPAAAPQAGGAWERHDGPMRKAPCPHSGWRDEHRAQLSQGQAAAPFTSPFLFMVACVSPLSFLPLQGDRDMRAVPLPPSILLPAWVL